MKKLIAVILSLVLALSLAACAGKTDVNETDEAKEVVDTIKSEDKKEDTDTSKKEETKKEESKKDTSKKEETKKDESKKDTLKKEEIKKEEPKKETVKKEEPKAEEPKKEEPKKEEPKKEEPVKEEEKKEEPKPASLGNTLLSDFKTKAASGMGVQEIADSLITSPYIKFSGGAMPVEEGYLSGFDNTEIKGFKSGVMIAPMIGSIAFVGYVFELENASEVPAFISTLQANANKRWNICVEADEMVTGSSGNKVFFVMCPKSLE